MLSAIDFDEKSCDGALAFVFLCVENSKKKLSSSVCVHPVDTRGYIVKYPGQQTQPDESEKILSSHELLEAKLPKMGMYMDPGYADYRQSSRADMKS